MTVRRRPRERGDQDGATPRIEYLRVENYRALRSVELRDLRPLTALLGANGSGKSTLFDVFSFLSECFQNGLRAAWDRRGRSRSAGSSTWCATSWCSRTPGAAR